LKKVAILQSSYIPWKGYFNIIKVVDEFVLLDDVQFTRRDWRNRNLIKTRNGLKWLTIPVAVKGHYLASISEVSTSDNEWRQAHWNQIKEVFRNAPYFNTYAPVFESLYLNEDERNLSTINYTFIKQINLLLKIMTPIRWSKEFDTPRDKTERLFQICKQLKADAYLSGPAAKSYLDVDFFRKNNIDVVWADYSNYPEYNQPYPPFEHHVSVIDLLFHEGPNAINFLKDSL
jgi:hypothetical protein